MHKPETTYAEWLKARLEERDLMRFGSHKLAARMFGVSYPTLHRWLTGQCTPRGNQMLYVAAALAGRDGELFAQLLLEQCCIKTLGTTDYQQFLAADA